MGPPSPPSPPGGPVGACLRHTHTWVCMHSYRWSYGTISIATAGPVCRFSYGDQLPSRYSIRDVVQYLVLYWVCSDGLCACVCSVSLRGFRAVCVTVSADQDSGCEPRQHQVAFVRGYSGPNTASTRYVDRQYVNFCCRARRCRVCQCNRISGVSIGGTG